jgi:integrase
MRRGEVLSLRWRDVDFERGTITLREHKTSGRDGAPKVLPMTAPVRALLAGAHRESGNAYVVTGVRPGRPFIGLQKVWERIRERAELEDVRLHDLRHGYASVGAAGGESLLVVGKLLGHGDQATTQRYAHLADDPVRAAAERISSTIARALDGSEGGDLVQMESGRPGR